jgi:hypothetical protein
VSSPNVTVRGDTFIKSLNVSIAKGNGTFAISEGSTLATEKATVDGKIFNYGTLDFAKATEASLVSNEADFFNHGIVKGNKWALQNFGSFFNAGKVLGQRVGLQSNLLMNNGTLGDEGSALDFLIHKSFINSHNIVGKSAKVVLTSDEKGFLNRGLISVADAELQISGAFENKGRSLFGKLTGFASTLLNSNEMISQTGSFSINSGKTATF